MFRGTEVRIDFRYKHSRIKQYLKDGRALRVETVINNPSDLGVPRRLHNLPELILKARQVNQRLLMIGRAGQSCAIGSALFERIHQPYNQEGHKPERCASGAAPSNGSGRRLCHLLQGLTGFTNKSLRGLSAQHLNPDYGRAR